MQVHRALRQFGHLANATPHGDTRDRMCGQILQHPARKIPHIQHGMIGQPVKLLDHPFRGRPGAARHMGQATGPRHINAAMNGCDPCRTAERAHNTGGSQNGQPTLDPQPGVPRLFGQFPPAGDRDFDLYIRGLAKGCGLLIHHLRHHLARHGIDGRFPHANRQSRFGHSPHAVTRLEHHTTARGAHRHHDQRPMGHVRVIARVLGDARARPTVACFGQCQRKYRGFTTRQHDPHLSRKRPAP